MIDENKEYTSADVLTLDDALSLTVLGYRVRADDMQDGAYIDYNFSGFRINFPGGSSSGWSKRAHDETVDWRVIDEPVVAPKPEAPKWGRAIPNSVEVRHVDPPVADVLVMGDGGKWGSAAPTPAPAPASVGKWGKAVVPKKDSWGRPLT